MSFDFFFKACNFWSKNLPTCNTCTSRTVSNSNIESSSSRKNSEILEPNQSVFSDFTPQYQSKITPPTQIYTNNGSPSSSRMEESEILSVKSKKFKFSGVQKGRTWSEEEDKMLINSVKKHDYKNWKNIAKEVPGRTATQCSQRWRRIQPYKSRQPWTKDEDKLILSLIDKHGHNWSLIANVIEGRTGKQVRERYLNKLDRNINRSKFTEEDDDLIINLYEKFGPKWKDISLSFKGRPENMVKNRFYSHIRKKLLLNPEKYQNILKNINNEQEMMTSTNSVLQPDQKMFLQDDNEGYQGKLENPDSYYSSPIDYQNEMNVEVPIQENNNMLIEECFADNNELNKNYDLAPLTPNYFENNQEVMQQENNHHFLIKLSESDHSNQDLEQKKQEEIEFFNTNANPQKIYSRGASDESKNLNLRHYEFLNKKQELLEIMTNEVKERIKNSQSTMPNLIIEK